MQYGIHVYMTFRHLFDMANTYVQQAAKRVLLDELMANLNTAVAEPPSGLYYVTRAPKQIQLDV
jgi:hypothetical protein